MLGAECGWANEGAWETGEHYLWGGGRTENGGTGDGQQMGELPRDAVTGFRKLSSLQE